MHLPHSFLMAVSRAPICNPDYSLTCLIFISMIDKINWNAIPDKKKTCSAALCRHAPVCTMISDRRNSDRLAVIV